MEQRRVYFGPSYTAEETTSLAESVDYETPLMGLSYLCLKGRWIAKLGAA